MQLEDVAEALFWHGPSVTGAVVIPIATLGHYQVGDWDEDEPRGADRVRLVDPWTGWLVGFLVIVFSLAAAFWFHFIRK